MDERGLSGRHSSPQDWLRQVLAVAPQVEVRGWSVPELKELSTLAGRVKSSMDSLLVRVAAEIAASGATASPEEVLQQTTRMSKRDSRRTAGTARALEELPNVAERLADGRISLDHAESLADTARQTGAEAVDSNPELLDRYPAPAPSRLRSSKRCRRTPSSQA